MPYLNDEIASLKVDLEIVAGMRRLAALVDDASVRLGLLHELECDAGYLKAVKDNLVSIREQIDKP